MKVMPAKLIASTLAVSLLVLPAGLAAKEKRGADLVVAKIDGSKVSGELIAVKPDSLLLLSAGMDLSIPLVDIRMSASSGDPTLFSSPASPGWPGPRPGRSWASIQGVAMMRPGRRPSAGG